MHEAAFRLDEQPQILEGNISQSLSKDGITTIQWKTQSSRSVVKFGNLQVYLLGAANPTIQETENANFDRSKLGI